MAWIHLDLSDAYTRDNPKVCGILLRVEQIAVIVYSVSSSDQSTAWRLLGGEDLNSLPARELGRVMRAFGKNPSEQDIQYLKYNKGLDGNILFLKLTCLYAYLIIIHTFGSNSSRT